MDVSNAASDDQKENEDDDVITPEGETVFLHDPVSLARIDIAARGVRCTHRARFDLVTYLEFTKLSGMWHCPYCDMPLPVSDLLIDDQFNRILKTTTDESISQVLIYSDGRIEPVSEERRLNRSTMGRQNPSSDRNNKEIGADTVVELDKCDIIELD